MSVQDPAPEVAGFHGDVSGLSLSDVIQLNGGNGFSGCIVVQQGSRTGRIFFREGKVVHAEQGAKSGEAAFYEIMEWRSGHFSFEPNVSTTSHTIQKSNQFILMEAHRLIDERRAGRSGPPADEPGVDGGARKIGPTGIAARLKVVPGVLHAVVIGRDGAYVDDGTKEGETLAGVAAYLAMIGNRVGTHLGAGEVRAIAVRRTTGHLIVLSSRSHCLGVAVDGAKDVIATEIEILKLLNPAS